MFAANVGMLLYYTQLKSDKEFKQQMLGDRRMALANTAGSLQQISQNLEPNTPQALAFQSQLNTVFTLDKACLNQMTLNAPTITALETMIESLNKQTSKNIEKEFKTFNNG